MPNLDIDLDRCISHCFVDHETMTPEQLALATELVIDGPPRNTQNVVLKWPPGARWHAPTKALTCNGVTVRISDPKDELKWTANAI